MIVWRGITTGELASHDDEELLHEIDFTVPAYRAWRQGHCAPAHLAIALFASWLITNRESADERPLSRLNSC
jgi:hypothetical protein